MKYFGIGLSKTGTSSLAKAFNILGYTSQHYMNNSMYNHMMKGTPGYSWDFVNDIPTCNRYPQLDSMFPSSKFIYTTRDVDAWLTSCKKHWKQNNKSHANSDWDSHKMEVYGRLDYHKNTFKETYEYHETILRHYFHKRPDDLLVIDIPGGEGWEVLCPFIGCDIPDKPFPCANKSS